MFNTLIMATASAIKWVALLLGDANIEQVTDLLNAIARLFEALPLT